MDFTNVKSPDADEIKRLAEEAWAGLPEAFRAPCQAMAIIVDDWPSDDVLAEFEAEDDPASIMGLYQGIALTEQSAGDVLEGPHLVFLYRMPILAYWAEHDETLGAIVRHVLIHEIGHHFGFSDEDMEAIEEG
ncbi:MAG TPA: metallopeptidase family protein [Micropepsaceae bacterium]|nr:metallopeptidase family protein [Micropepsaceae bacterium]